jgi:hypothetical protein
VKPLAFNTASGQPSGRLSRHKRAGFRQGLSEEGFVEGRNVEIEFRWGNNQQERLPDFAADLVGRKVGVKDYKGADSPTSLVPNGHKLG